MYVYIGICQARPYDLPTEHLHVHGLRIAYERTGAGVPVVLLHGGLADSREWRPQLDGLTDDFDLIAWHAPGCGGSDDPPSTFRMPDYADVLAAFIDELGIARPHVVGLSFGSTLALEFYRRHPRVPRTLVLVSAYAGWAGSLPPNEVAARLAGARREITQPPEVLAQSLVDTLFTEDAPRGAVAEIFEMTAEFHPQATITLLESMAEADLRDVLPKIEVPTLLLYGEADVRSPLTVARDLHAAIPGSRLAIVEGAGHQVNVEAPERFNAELRAFLSARA